ncbi:hypothetical protein CATMIT_01754, partial [Catenibacterium mitsuokai DSM 15897]
RGVVAVREQQLLGPAQRVVEVHVLAGREQAVVEGVGQQHRGAVAVERGDLGHRAALRHDRQQAGDGAVEIAQGDARGGLGQLRAGTAGQRAGHHQQAAPCWLTVRLAYSDASRSAQPLSAATALMRGSRSAASRLMPAP